MGGDAQRAGWVAMAQRTGGVAAVAQRVGEASERSDALNSAFSLDYSIHVNELQLKLFVHKKTEVFYSCFLGKGGNSAQINREPSYGQKNP